MLHLAEADLEVSRRAVIIRQRLNLVAKPNSLASNVVETVFEDRPWCLFGCGVDGRRAGCRLGRATGRSPLVFEGEPNMPGPLNVNLLLGLVAIVAVASTVLSMLALAWVTRRGRGAGLPEHTPPMTIFKPLKGLDEELEANLRSFFHLDYPVYQLLFGVAEAGDPAIAVVQKLMGEHPDRDARLVVGAPAFGLNPKVENLASMDRFRKYDVILISDSNVRVRPSRAATTTMATPASANWRRLPIVASTAPRRSACSP